MRYVAVLLILLCCGWVWGQESDIIEHLIFQQNLVRFQWNSDSTGVILSAHLNDGSMKQDHEYSLITQQLYPINDPVLDHVAADLEANSRSTEYQSAVSISPDQQWAIYASDIVANDYIRGGRLTIKRLHDGMVRTFPDIGIYYPDSPGRFVVKWSANSTAFYIHTFSDIITRYYYVSGLPDLDNVTGITLRDDGAEFGVKVGSLGRVNDVYDIDPTGQFLLMIKNFPSAEVYGKWISHLFIFNMKTLTIEKFVTKGRGIVAAEFAPGDTVYYINHDGLFLYNTSKRVTALLNSGINGSWIQKADISPDGKYVAATERGISDAVDIVSVSPESK